MSTNPFLDAILNRISEITELEIQEVRPLLQRPPDLKLGDYAFPCFILAKKLRKNPAFLATELVNQFQADEYIERVESKGPYLNFFLKRQNYIELVLSQIHHLGNDYGKSNLGADKTIVIDYSSPNIAKPLGVHHLCSTMIGNCLYRTYQLLGYQVIGINHLGDWGTQFGIMLAAYTRWGDSKDDLTVNDLVKLYIRYSKEMKEDESMADEAREWFRNLENGDKEVLALWQRFRDISLKEFERVYKRLGVHFDSFAGESFYNEMLAETVARLEKAELTKRSDEALIVDLSDFKMPPCILKKSDDTSLYATRDLAAIEYRKKTYRFDRALYVVGADQSLHFKQIFKVLELLGDDAAGKCVHVDFGLVLFKNPEADGWVKGSTRKDNLELLDDVLDRASELALKIIEENQKEMQYEVSKDATAEAIGLAAVVFGILGTARKKNVKFDWDEILSFKGQTGPYLQYAHARQASILRKYGKLGREISAKVNFDRLNDPEEFELAKKLQFFPDLVQRASEDFEPSMISNYLLELVAIYSRYSQDSVHHRIVSDDEELTAARVLLVSCVRTVLEKGLYLLGISAPQQM